MRKLLALIAVPTLTGLLAAGALAASAAPLTVAPTAAQRAAILKAFGSPGAPVRCLGARLAASNHAYATVRFHPATGCARWGFNGVNILQHRHSGGWKVRFEASEYTCPRPAIPRSVQRELDVCP